MVHSTRSVQDNDSTRQKCGIGFLAPPVLLAIALIGLAIVQPATSDWIAETVEAEFPGGGVMPDQAPAQLARLAMQIRTVRAN